MIDAIFMNWASANDASDAGNFGGLRWHSALNLTARERMRQLGFVCTPRQFRTVPTHRPAAISTLAT
jgi:hypothetical protein